MSGVLLEFAYLFATLVVTVDPDALMRNPLVSVKVSDAGKCEIALVAADECTVGAGLWATFGPFSAADDIIDGGGECICNSVIWGVEGVSSVTVLMCRKYVPVGVTESGRVGGGIVAPCDGCRGVALGRRLGGRISMASIGMC